MKPGRFQQIKEYLNCRYFHSKSFPGILEDKDRKLVYCDVCQKEANAVIEIKMPSGRSFNIPLCRTHYRKKMPNAMPIIEVVKRKPKFRKPKPWLRPNSRVYVQYPK